MESLDGSKKEKGANIFLMENHEKNEVNSQTLYFTHNELFRIYKKIR